MLAWKPPSTNFLKINTDASFNQNTQNASLGVVARDEQGEVLSAVAKMNNIQNSLQAKVLAILFGVKLMIERE